MSKMKEAQLDFIVAVATKLFVEKSISEVTMSDIAKEVGVGEATLYRYFGKKQNIVFQCAIRLAKKVYNDFLESEKGNNGIEKMENFYNIFSRFYHDRRDFYVFIYQFDAFLLSNKSDETDNYEDVLSGFKEIFDSAYQEGIKDGTVKVLEDPTTFYFATTHSLLNLCKKLSCEGDLVHLDTLVSKEKEIQIMISIVINSLKA